MFNRIYFVRGERAIDNTKHTPQWYHSEEAKKAFEAAASVADKASFLYSYLRGIVDHSFDEDGALFKVAVLLADEITQSELPYAAYEALVDINQNPLLAYLMNAAQYCGEEALLSAFTAILQGKADPYDTASWIYKQS